MLSNLQVEALVKRMGVPLEPVVFKSELKDRVLKYNKSYIINLEDEFDEEGQKNAGSHYVAFQVNNYLDKPDELVYFDSYGCALLILKELLIKDIRVKLLLLQY